MLDSATSTSPFGSTSIQRGCCSPVANALTFSPGAATGVCPTVHPFAVGILSVGILPCDFAAGMAGASPQAGSGKPVVNRRDTSAAPPTTATTRAKTSEKANSVFPLVANSLTEAALVEPNQLGLPSLKRMRTRVAIRSCIDLSNKTQVASVEESVQPYQPGVYCGDRMAQLSDDCFAFGGRLIPLHETSRLLEDTFTCVAGTVSTRLLQAAGRVLAEDLVSSISVPPHANSAVDGYAVHFDDLSASEETVLTLQGRATAGHPLETSLPRGHATRVFTGAVMPDGPDTVLMQEDCLASAAEVRIRPGIKRGANRRLAGEDVTAGSIVLRAGRRLGPPEIGLAAALGILSVPVRARLRVAVFSTGDEVAEPGTPLLPGQIYDSNRAMITCLLTRAGLVVTDGGILPDQSERLRYALHQASLRHDLIITSGGVSTGEEDHLRDAIKQLGTLSFWRVAIKPGRPVAVGTVGDTPLVGLPGNPVAAMVAYMAIARPLIAVLGGETHRQVPRFAVTSGFAYRKKIDRREFVRVRFDAGPSGLVAYRFKREGAGILTSLTESDALAELPETMTALEPGQLVGCLPLSMLYD